MELHNKKVNLTSVLKKVDIDEENKIAYISGWASKSYDSEGNLVIDRDGEHVLTSGFKIDKARTLLRDHKLDYPVGKMTLTHKKEGIWIDAEVHEKMCDKTYYAVKNGILDSFSIGFLITEATYVSVQGEDYLQFTKGEVYETSILSTASNTEAVIQNIKSIVSDEKCVGLQCSIESIKSMNPDMDCSCLADLKKETNEKGETLEKEIKEKLIKGLTIDETMSEYWNVDDNLWQMFRYFIQTIEDNIYEFKWSETYSQEEMMTNINSAMEMFKETITEESTRIGEVVGKNLEEGITKSMKTEGTNKEAEVATETVVEQPQEVVAEVQTEEKVEEETPKETTTEEVQAEVTQTEEQVSEVDSQSNESEQQEEVKKEELANTFEFNTDVIQILKTDLNEASAEEIQQMYDSLADKLEQAGAWDAIEALRKIEDYVAQELATN